MLVDPALGIDSPVTPLPLYLRSQSVRSTLVSAAITNPLLTKRMLQMLIHRKDRAMPNYVTVLQRPLAREGTTDALQRGCPSLCRQMQRRSAHGQPAIAAFRYRFLSSGATGTL